MLQVKLKEWRICIKEGVLLRIMSPSLVLFNHFPGGGVLELQTGSSWEWPFIVCLFWE